MAGRRAESQVRTEVREGLSSKQLAFLVWHLIYQNSNDDPRQASQYLLSEGAREVTGMELVPAGVNKYLDAYRKGGNSAVMAVTGEVGQSLAAAAVQTGVSCRAGEIEMTVPSISTIDTTDLVKRVEALGTKVDEVVAAMTTARQEAVAPQKKGAKAAEAARDTHTQVSTVKVAEIAKYLGVSRDQITVQNINGRRPGVMEVGCVSCVPVLARATTEFGRTPVPEPTVFDFPGQADNPDAGNQWRTGWMRGLGILGAVALGTLLLPGAPLVMAATYDPLLVNIDKKKMGRLPAGAENLIDAFNETSRMLVKTAVDLLSFAELGAAFDAALKDRSIGARQAWDTLQRERVTEGLSILADIALAMRQGFDAIMNYQHAYWNQLQLSAEGGVVPEGYGLLLPTEAATLGSMVEAMFTGLRGEGKGVKVAGTDDRLINRMQNARL